MTASFQKIRRLYGIPDNQHFGFSENEIGQLEKELESLLPATLREYYLTLGKHEMLNYSYNRLLKPGGQIGFTPDNYLAFYEEHQVVVYWAIRHEDLSNPNPPVYGNYSNDELNPDWHLELPTTDSTLLMLSVYNGVLGGLRYNGNRLDSIKPEVVEYIKTNWQEVDEISTAAQRIFTRDFDEVISLSIDQQQNCSGIFIGTNHRDRFDNMIDVLDVHWNYLSTEDEDSEEDEEE